ncbi:hypothetical protein K443DRAFT_123345 [Laccaria amethystina LaAM-08-1]|jgi:hypothetical protein|uniref:Uncharacterized protein n=1 Tax=Laccaria amethystina LaAM-08-1 TaxID=1095629 RepID=A0A0C9X232_9AGAR|nr:hypothetical protein K443DRAFT_123345 [Laccaria amethystina LaAM-08-1]
MEVKNRENQVDMATSWTAGPCVSKRLRVASATIAERKAKEKEGERRKRVRTKGKVNGGKEGEGERGRGRRRERRRGNTVVARTPTSNMSVKGGGVSLYEMRGKEGNSLYTTALTNNHRRRGEFLKAALRLIRLDEGVRPYKTNDNGKVPREENGVGYLRVHFAISSARRLASCNALHRKPPLVPPYGEHFQTCGILLPVASARLNPDSRQAIHLCTEIDFRVFVHVLRGFVPVSRCCHTSGLDGTGYSCALQRQGV